MKFELKNEGSNSFEKEESLEPDNEVDLHTQTLRMFDHVRRPVERYNPSNFHFAFVLFAINDEPIF